MLKRLTELCAKQDRRAQRELYDLYAKRCMGMSIRYVPDQSTAEDVVQEAFVRIFRSINKLNYETVAGFEMWMRRIVINESIRRIKKDKKFQWDHGPIQAYSENDAISNLGLTELLKSVQELPDGYRVIFNLAIIEGYDHKAIARLLDISESTSRSQLSRARSLLKSRLIKMKYYEI